MPNGSSAPSVAHRWLTLACVCAAMGVSALQAQTIYRSVGSDGKVTFSDHPPVVTPASKLKPAGNAVARQPAGSTLPFELRQVVAKYPVTLYTSSSCTPCDGGRSLLLERGVPFTEKTVTTAQDAAALQNLSGSTSLPFLTIGAQHVGGYSSTAWTQYLDAAGYPQHSKLPASYRSPVATAMTAPEPVANQSAPKNAATPVASPQVTAPTKPKVNHDNPAGIQF
ncbi:MAG: hypothetical protein AUK50_13535 [Comamonadaceae bacterium CG2_30_57_122]|nr:MAG: hypothetical protein AUK50_13535 [Comamonadaceae bacterium CG2_30_57_122]